MAGLKTRILVVDDDQRLRDLLVRYLGGEGYEVKAVADAAGMDKQLSRERYDLVVLDLMLPGEDGLAICRRLRAQNVAPAIVMLTAKGDEVDRIVGLEMGADDYLPKPFNPRELLARINAVLRRARGSSPAAGAAGGHVLGFAGWRLDTRRRELTNPAGVVVDLSTGEYDLLLTFLEQPQRPLTRDQLMDAAKNRVATGFDRAIDIQVSRLRKKIDAAEDGQTMIRTIRGTGYMFVPEVQRS
jgi:two-component system OmpR family response regulator